MKHIIYITLLFIPLLINSQLLNKEFFTDNYRFVDLIDSSNNYSNDEIKIISILINDDFTGKLKIKHSDGKLIHEYSLDEVKGVDGEEASAMLFENCTLVNIIDNKKYSIYVVKKKDSNSSYNVIVKYMDKSFEQYYDLKEWD